MDVQVRPEVIVLCGLPGSGKTTFARKVERERGAVRFSTDEWMADLGFDYFDQVRDRLQARLDRLWRQLVEHQVSVILEDGSWKRAERDEIRRFASARQARVELHYFDIPLDVLRSRLDARNASPAHGVVPITQEVLEESVHRFEAPEPAELVLFDAYTVHTAG